MKKVSRVFGIIACGFVMLSAMLLTACGASNPFDVKGTTLQGNGECFVVWSDTATQEYKDEVYATKGVKNDKELAQLFAQANGEYFKTVTYTFKEDGTCEKMSSNVSKPTVYYYEQQEDLKTIKFYEDAEHTKYISDDLKFANGNFCTSLDWSDLSIYFILKSV
ncbi:MAG: hypothetical protein ACI4TZ_01555 [Christensenellales bacterium]